MTPKSLIEPARHAGTALLRSQTDARLVDLTREGNERAFEAIVQRYRRPLLRYCSRLLSTSRAEDAVQQAFLSAHRAIHAGDAELNLRPWLYRIAHNMSLNLLRQAGFDHEQVSEEIDGVETPPQAFERGERLRTVVAAVRELPERQRSAIVLQALEGRSYDEIADELGVSDGAVRQLLNRARNTLREAAAALTPAGLLTRVAANGGEVTVAERVAQVVGGAGGGALVAKAGAALVIAGAVAGGAATGGLPGHGNVSHHRNGGGASAAVAQAPAPSAASPSVPRAHRSDVVLTTRRSGGRHGSSRGNAAIPSGRGNDGRSSSGSGSGSGSSGGDDHHGGDHSGSGSSDDHSGSGSGSGSGSSDHSGSGSSDGSSDHSGSGDGSATPADDTSPNSGTGSSSSGSGSSGSDDTTATPTTTTTPVETHSGRGDGSSGKSSDDGSDDPPPSGTSH